MHSKVMTSVVGTGDFTIEFWYFDDGGHSGTDGRNYLFDNNRWISNRRSSNTGRMADGTEVNFYITSGGGTQI